MQIGLIYFLLNFRDTLAVTILTYIHLNARAISDQTFPL